MKLRAHGLTDRGLGRTLNQDALLLDDSCHAYAVADGVGGQAGGDRASEAAMSAVGTQLAHAGCRALDDLSRVVDHAHEAVQAAGRSFAAPGIATTLTLAHFKEDQVRVAHVGDSCALLVRDNRAIALTRKHNVESERPDLFTLAPFSESFRTALTRALGQRDALPVDLSTSQVRTGDRFVLATDGLTDLVSPDEIAACTAHAPDPDVACDRLLQLVLRRGAPDNVAVIVIVVDAV